MKYEQKAPCSLYKSETSNIEFLPVFQEDIEVRMRSGCGDTSGWDNRSCGICEGPLSVSDTPP